MILAGDIGGTKTLIALLDESGDALRLVREEPYPSREHSSLEDILDRFLHGGTGPPHPTLSPTGGEGRVRGCRAACFGVAGPVLDGQCRTTNLPWHLAESTLARALGGAEVKLLNDLQATGYGMLFLPADQLCPLNPQARPARPGNIAVIAAGTGLGEAFLAWDGQHHHPLASEGGHADFAPRTDREIELLRYLRPRHDHISWERVLSGPGIHNIFSFLRDSGTGRETPALTARLQAGGDPSVAITELALSGEGPLCVAALDLFAHLYGAEAGNLALVGLATGGVFVGGGIAPKILPILKRGGFLAGFLDKGRLRTLLETLPIQVALDPRAALLGAAHYAARMARRTTPDRPPDMQP